jgi:DNA-binding transcriptional LysR family regulator
MNLFNDITINNLKLFVAVIEHRNFSAVARREGINPSSISRMVTQLEKQLNVQLLHRHSRAISPTEAGLLLEKYARSVLEQLNEAEQILGQQATVPQGIFKINAPVFFGEHFIAPHIPELLTRYPELRIELAQTNRYIDPLDEAVDLIFRIGARKDSSMRIKVFRKMDYALVASKAYLADAPPLKTPNDLKHHRCIVLRCDNGGLQNWSFRQGKADFKSYDVPTYFINNHAETTTHLVCQGVGLSILPTWMIQDELKNNMLIPLLEDYEACTSREIQYLSALYPNTRKPSLKVRLIIDFLAEKFKALPA